MHPDSRRLCAVTLAILCLAAPSSLWAQRGGGPDADFPADREVFQWLLRHHDRIQRQVTEIPDGVETRTESDDPEVADYIRRHVTAMVRRVETGRGFHYRDPLFAALFRHAGEIHVEVEPTTRGVLVRETGQSPAAVQLIRAHAHVVSLFVQRGFDELHRNHTVPKPASGKTAASGDRAAETPVAVFLEFDRAYIPALALTNQGKLEASREALQRLHQVWASSQGRLQMAFSDAATWEVVSETVRQSLDAAKRHLAEEEMPAAHESLEPVREVMTTARRAVGFDYPLDLLTDFHDTMELIVKPAVKMTSANIAPEYLAQLPSHLSKASLQWRRVENTNFQTVISGVDADLLAKVQAVRRALDATATGVELGGSGRDLVGRQGP